jgi:hypothetical protein
MRKALFAVVLVCASFAGGAVVNGPGLRWAQSVASARLGLGLSEGSEGDAGELETLSAHHEPPSSRPGDPEQVPARPIPPLVIDAPDLLGKADGGENSGAADEPGKSSKSTPAGSDLADSALPGLAPVPETAPPLEPPAPLTTSQDRPNEANVAAIEPKSRIDKEKTEAPRDEDRGKTGTDDGPSGKPSLNDPPVRLASVEDAPAASPAPGTGGDGDWAEVRRTMRSLGVSRYGIEGEPGGRVRFHCVIPLAGRRAVGQQFEAEGDDDLQAARAALKRVALWRATESAPPAR